MSDFIDEFIASRTGATPAQSGPPETPDSLPGNFVDQFIASRSEDAFGSVGQAVRGSVIEGQTNRATGVAPPSGGTDFNAQPGAISQIVDETTRAKIQDDLRLVGRAGLEIGGGLTGARAATAAAGKAGLGKVAAGALETAGTAIGEGLGSLAAQPIDPVVDPLGTARRTVAFGVFGDSVSQGLLSGVRNLTRGGSDLSHGARNTMRILGDDALPSAGRLSKSTPIDLAENFVENSLTSGGRVSRRNEAAASRANDLLEAHVNRFTQGASRQEIDNLVRDVTEGSLDSFKQTASAMYAQLDGLGAAGTSTDGIVRLRNQIVDENKSGAFGATSKALVKAIDRTLGTPARFTDIDAGQLIPFGAVPENVPFSEMAKLRSDAQLTSRDSTDPFASQAGGVAKRISREADLAIDSAGASFTDPEALGLWREANRFWKDGSEAFGSSVMRALASTNPDQLFGAIMASDSPQQIASFRKMMLGGTGTDDSTARDIIRSAERVLRSNTADRVAKDAARRRISQAKDGQEKWQKFQGHFFSQILRGADKGAGIGLSEASAARTVVGSKALDRWSSFGDEALSEIFPKKTQRQRAERLMRVLEVTQAGTGRGEGTFATQMVQAGAVFQLLAAPLGGGLPNVASMAILASPPVLGRLMDSPEFIKWATIGSKAKPGTEHAIKAYTRMSTLAIRAGARAVSPDGRVLEEADTEEAKRLREIQALIKSRE